MHAKEGQEQQTKQNTIVGEGPSRPYTWTRECGLGWQPIIKKKKKKEKKRSHIREFFFGLPSFVKKKKNFFVGEF